MADDLRDEDVAARYGDLRRPEPPRALDDAILAASRRAVGARPGGADGGRRGSPTARWALPASVAAVLALSVMVTIHVQEEQPGLEPPAPRATPEAKREVQPPAPGATADAAPSPAPQEKLAAKEPAPAPATSAPRAAEAVAKREAKAATERSAVASNAATRSAAQKLDTERPSPGFASDPPTVATAPAIDSARAAPSQPVVAQAPAAPAVAAAPPAPAARELRARGELSRDDARAAAKLADAAEPPEKQLERIAALRKDGRHAEADQLLKEFRARYPGYRIPEAMLEKVEPPR